MANLFGKSIRPLASTVTWLLPKQISEILYSPSAILPKDHPEQFYPKIETILGVSS